MATHPLNRRQMLQLLGTSALGPIVLAACGGTPQTTAPTVSNQSAGATSVPDGIAATVIPDTAAAPTSVPTPTPAVGSVGENAQTVLNFMTQGGSGAVTDLTKNYNVLTNVYPELKSQIGLKDIGLPGDFEVAQALRLALAGGQNIPDIVQFSRTQVREFADELTDLSDTFTPVAIVIIFVAFQDTFISGVVVGVVKE